MVSDDTTLMDQHELAHRLQERIKELSCLYDVTSLLNRPELTQHDLAQAIVERLIPAWQYPQVTCARMDLFGTVYESANFADSPWQQHSDIMTGRTRSGVLTVGYLEECPPEDEGPFLKEERSLIDQCASQIGNAFESRRLQAELSVRESLLKSIMETSPDSICAMDRTGRVQYINRSMSGTPPEQIIGHSMDELGVLADHPLTEQGVREVLRTGQPKRLESSALGPDGSALHYSTRIIPIGPEERMDGVLLIAQDITQQKLAENVIRSSEERYRALFDASIDAVLVLSPATGEIISANAAASKLFGWSEDELTQLTRNDVVDTTDPRLDVSIRTQARIGSFRAELTFVRKDGSKFVGDIATASFLDSSGEVRTSMSIHDVTSRKQAAVQQAYLATLVDSMPAAIISTDTHLRIQSWNAHAIEMYGWRREETIGAELRRVCGDALADAVLAGHDRSQGEFEQARSDGGHFFVQASTAAVLNQERATSGYVVICVDSTDRKRAEQELVESEARYRQAIAAAGAIAYGMDYSTGEFSFVSPGAETIIGYSAEVFGSEFVRSRLLHSIPRGQFEGLSIAEATARARAGTALPIWECDYCYLTPDGEERWVSDVAVQVPDEYGKPKGSIGILQNITGRKQAEQALAESNARFQSLFEMMTIGVVYQEADGRISMANRAAEQILGLSLDQMQGRTSTDPRWHSVREDGSPFPGEEHPAMVALRTGEIVTDTVMGVYHPQKGEIRWVRVAAVPEFRPDEEKPFRVFGIFDDITERRRAEQAIVESEARYRDAIKAAGAAAYTVDFVSGEYTFASQEFGDFFGYPPEELSLALVESSIIEATPMGRFAGLTFAEANELSRSGQGGALWQCDYLVRKRGGELRWLFDASVQTLDERGYAIGSFGILQDVTTRKQIEIALRASEDNYRKLAEELEQRVQERTAQVRSSEARLNYLLANTPAIIFTMTLIGEDLALTYVSNSAHFMLGYTQHQFASDPGMWLDLVHPEDRALIDATFEAFLLSGKSTWEMQLRHANGQYRWFSVGLNFTQRPFDGKNEIIGYAVDMHEEKQAQDALRVSEARLRSVLEHAPASILEVDRNGVVLSVNRMLSGMPAANLVGRSLLDFVSRQDRGAVEAALHQLFEQQQPITYETSMTYPSGEVHSFVSYAGPIALDDRVESAVIVSLDITALKRAQADLQVQRDFASQIMDALGQGLVVSSNDGKAEYVNPFMANLLGLEPSAIIGTPLNDYIPREELAERLEELGKIPSDGSYYYELRLRGRDGTIVPVLVSSTPRWKDGQAIGRIALFTDLTQLKEIERSLRQSRDELSDSNLALQRAIRMKDEFLASMSHELRTPLTGIMGLSEALQLQTFGTLNDRQLRALSTIFESGQHLLALINDILDLSKLAASQFELEKERCSVEEVCNSSLSLIKGMAHKKDQRVMFAMEQPAIEIDADPRRLKQMLVNLLGNAVKFTPERGTLGLTVRHDADRQVVEFVVWDKGIGIALEDQARIFQPFTQLDSSLTRQFSGTGLGLTLVQRMAQLHGGTLTVRSEPGAGSEFTLTIPVGESSRQPLQEVVVEPRAVQADTAFVAAGPTGSLSILLAEDDDQNATMLTEYLTFHGYSVEVAGDGAEAVRKAIELHPDLVLMDIRMPVLDGFGAIEQLRSYPDAQIATVPIVALTAQALRGDAERCLEVGANAYVSKPYRFAEVLAAIRGLLQHEKERK